MNLPLKMSLPFTSQGKICFFQEEASKSNLGTLRKNVNAWLKDHNIKAFFSATQDEKFSAGAKNCMNLVGIGKRLNVLIHLK